MNIDTEDCTVVRKSCGCVALLFVTKYIDAETKKDIGELVADGATVEHMPAAEARKQQFGCSHAEKQHDIFAGEPA